MRVFTGFLRLTAVIGICAFACPAAEVIMLGSSFENGDEGWTAGDFFNSNHGWLPSHFTFGGTPGGYIETDDIYGFNAFHAPSSWLGDQSRLYGGVLHVSQKALSSDGLTYPLVVLSNGVMKLQFRTPPPSSNWTEFLIPLIGSAGWEIGNGSGDRGTPATEDDLKKTLASINWFAFNADWQTGDDKVSLDDVFVVTHTQDDVIPETTPEPASLALSAAALGFLAVLKKRRPAK